MMETNKIRREQVAIKIKNSQYEWLATAHNVKSDTMVGFIRFLKSKGVLEITNFSAQLCRKALNLGVSSKRNSEHLAGTHGEGFKIATLTMIREDYQVRYESSNYYWNFYLGGSDKGDLYCRFSPVKETELEKRKATEYSRRPSTTKRDAVSCVWEDVTVKIGKVYGKKGDRIMFSTFEDWIKVSLVLEGPSQVIASERADLIMDKSFSGKIYLKGLFLGGGHASKKLKFAYNFHTGHVSRDRQRMTDDEEEAFLIAHVWAQAIQKCEPCAIDEYFSMLQEDDDKHWYVCNAPPAFTHFQGPYIKVAFVFPRAPGLYLKSSAARIHRPT